MDNKDLIENNPLRVLYKEKDNAARMGLVMSRAGLGKTAILVQIALDSILCGKKVLHVSIGQSLDKTRIWYDDIYKDIAAAHKLANPAELQDTITRNRLIMTFNESSFSRPKLEERLNDLIYQNIFRPDCLIVDGYDFDKCDRQVIADIRELTEATGMNTWFSALCRREDISTSGEGVPSPCNEIGELFDTVILLKPEKEETCIAIKVIKDTSEEQASGKTLNLDPATLMIRERYDNC